MSSIRAHLSKEVKKRGALRLAIDVSYKEAKKLCRVGGKAVYVGLVTGVNEVGEIRLQFHIVSDSHSSACRLRGIQENYRRIRPSSAEVRPFKETSVFGMQSPVLRRARVH